MPYAVYNKVERDYHFKTFATKIAAQNFLKRLADKWNEPHSKINSVYEILEVSSFKATKRTVSIKGEPGTHNISLTEVRKRKRHKYGLFGA